MFRYLSVGQGLAPPVAEDLQSSVAEGGKPGRPRASHSVGCVAVPVSYHQVELNPHVGGKRLKHARHRRHICVLLSKVLVQNGNLTVDLGL